MEKACRNYRFTIPRSEIIVLGDSSVHNSDWLSYSSNITNPVGRDAEAFAIINDLTLVISEPTCVPDRAGDKANTLDFLQCRYSRCIFFLRLVCMFSSAPFSCLLILVVHYFALSSTTYVFITRQRYAYRKQSRASTPHPLFTHLL